MSPRTQGTGLGVALAICASAAPATAQPLPDTAPPTPHVDSNAGENPPPTTLSRLKVEVTGCAAIRPERVEQLLRLELATLVPSVSELPPLEVHVLCAEPRVLVTLGDSVTSKWVTREVSLDTSPDPERVLAVVTSELFLASWAELLFQKLYGRPIVASDSVAAAPPVPPPLSGRSAVAIDLLAIGRERHASEPVRTLGAAVRIGPSNLERWQPFAVLGWETGSAERAAGRVDLSATEAGLGLRWCLHFAKAEFALTGAATAVYIRMDGVPTSPSFYGSPHDGFAAELSAGIEADVSLKTVRLGGAILGGVLEPGPVGQVDGDASVRFDGAWVGVTLFAGLLL